MNDQILELKSQEIQDKHSSQSSLKEYKEQMNAQLEKTKATLNQTSEKLINEQKNRIEK